MTPSSPSTWLVVPCYNEANRLPVAEFKAFSVAHPDLGFCFVNDGSADATSQILHQLAQEGEGRMLALDLPVNSGKAEAVRAGVNHLVETIAPVWVGYWDADLATPLDEIPRFQAQAARNPAIAFVLGARVRRMGAQIDRRPLRHYLGRIFATAASAMLGLPVYDTQCGAKLIRADLAAKIFDRPFVSRWIFDVELIGRTIRVMGLAQAMQALLEYPLDQWTEVGESRVRPRHFLRAPLELYRIHQNLKTYR